MLFNTAFAVYTQLDILVDVFSSPKENWQLVTLQFHHVIFYIAQPWLLKFRYNDITAVMFSNELMVFIGGHGHMAEGDG